MDPDMIRPRRSKPCPPPPPLLKKEAHGENIVQACQHDSCNFRGHPLPFLPSPPPSLWPCHPPPRPPSYVRNYWNDDLDRFSRMQRVEGLDMGYKMNFRDPLNDFHEDHTLRNCMALHPPSAGHHRHGPPPMLMGHHREPLTSYFPPPGDYSYQHGHENPNGCTTM